MIPPRSIDSFLVAFYRRGWRGFHFLHRMRCRLGGRREITCATRYGSLFALNLNSYIDLCVLREGFYESEVFEALRPFLGDSSVFWDIGGNIGLHAVTAAVLQPRTRVLAFEPATMTATRLRANAALNAAAVEVVEFALGATTGWRDLHVVAHGNDGMTSLHRWDGVNYDYVTKVWCARADELVEKEGRPCPTVVKLDVEGSETEVLIGFGQLLRRRDLRAIVFESDTGLNGANAGHPAAVLLRDAGFQLRRLERAEATQHGLDNYLAVRA